MSASPAKSVPVTLSSAILVRRDEHQHDHSHDGEERPESQPPAVNPFHLSQTPFRYHAMTSRPTNRATDATKAAA